MFDVWLSEPSGQLDLGKKEAAAEEDEGWNGILPISATQVKPTQAPKQPITPMGFTPAPADVSQQSILSRILRRNRPIPAPSTPSGSPSSLEAQTPQSEKPGEPSTPKSASKDGEKEVSQVQVSLLIAMPSASRPSSHILSGSTSTLTHSHTSSEDDPKGKLKASSAAVSAWSDLEEGEIPHLELGVLEVGYRGEKEE